MMAMHQYLRAHPEAVEVLEFIRSFPEGVTSSEVGRNFPDMPMGVRVTITRNLHDWGYIRKKPRSENKKLIWVAV